MPLQRLGGPAELRSGDRRPGAAAGCDDGAVRRRCTSTSRSTPSLSLLALWAADGPDRRDLPHLQPALAGDAGRLPAAAAQPGEDRGPHRGLRGRPAHRHRRTSAATRSSSPTGSTSTGSPRAGRGRSGRGRRSAPTIAFVGRIDEPRKGLPVLSRALPQVAGRRARRCACWWPAAATRGGGATRLARRGRRPRASSSAWSATRTRPRCSRSVDVYVAPHTGGESFGIVLVEAMSAGAPVLASDLAAFRRVLDDGARGELFATGDADALAARAGRAAAPTRPAGRAGRPRRAGTSGASTGRWSAARDPGGLRDRHRVARRTCAPRPSRTCVGTAWSRGDARPGREDAVGWARLRSPLAALLAWYLSLHRRRLDRLHAPGRGRAQRPGRPAGAPGRGGRSSWPTRALLDPRQLAAARRRRLASAGAPADEHRRRPARRPRATCSRRLHAGARPAGRRPCAARPRTARGGAAVAGSWPAQPPGRSWPAGSTTTRYRRAPGAPQAGRALVPARRARRAAAHVRDGRRAAAVLERLA